MRLSSCHLDNPTTLLILATAVNTLRTSVQHTLLMFGAHRLSENICSPSTSLPLLEQNCLQSYRGSLGEGGRKPFALELC